MSTNRGFVTFAFGRAVKWDDARGIEHFAVDLGSAVVELAGELLRIFCTRDALASSFGKSTGYNRWPPLPDQAVMGSAQPRPRRVVSIRCARSIAIRSSSSVAETPET